MQTVYSVQGKIDGRFRQLQVFESRANAVGLANGFLQSFHVVVEEFVENGTVSRGIVFDNQK